MRTIRSYSWEDYIDRGPDSKQVIETLISLRDLHPNTVFLRGNHEQEILNAFEAAPSTNIDEGALPLSDVERNWLPQGGAETLRSLRPDFGDSEEASWSTDLSVLSGL